MNRGRRREPIFEDDEDCQQFLDVIGDVVGRRGVEVHAYALMPNHYHLLLRSVRGDLSRAMQDLGGGYTQRLNAKYGWDGPVFRGRFKNQLIAAPEHLDYLLAYLHLNAVRANLVARPDEPSWSSHRAYVGLEGAPDWLTMSHFHGALRGPEGVEDFVRRVHGGAAPWPAALNTASGWLVDGPNTRFAPVARSPGPRRLSPAAVEALVCEITGASPAALRTVVYGPKANPARRFAVWALRHETELSITQIARQLEMSPHQAERVLHRLRADGSAIADWRAAWEARRGARR